MMKKQIQNKISAICLILLSFSMFSIVTVTCRPSKDEKSPRKIIQEVPDDKIDTSEYYGNLSADTVRKIQKCELDMDLMELCMRCAKVTKSQIVYPMCCANEDNVKNWCHDYIYFGTVLVTT